jgi:signal transduction histidine kinase
VSSSQLARGAVERLRALTGADRASILLFDAGWTSATYLAVDPDNGIRPTTGDRVPVGDLLPLDILRQPLTLTDLTDEEGGSPLAERLLAQGLRSAITASLQADGELIGFINIVSGQAQWGDPSSHEVIREIADQLAIALRHASLKEDLERHTHELEHALSDLSEVNRARQLLLSKLIRAQEEERHRIASDIHDDPVQQLTAVSIRLGTLEFTHPEIAGDEDFEGLARTVSQAIDSMRTLMFDLRPYVLDRDGLAPALQLYLDTRIAVSDGPTCRLENHLSADPDPESRVVLYRIAQEALSNARKHAAASSVEVILEPRTGGYALTVRDNGRGFEASSGATSAQEGHLGLTTMRERAETAGGWCTVESSPGHGTSVEVWLPDGSPSGAGA